MSASSEPSTAANADHQREAQRHREIVGLRRLPDLPAHALDVEHGLDDQRPADDLREAEPDQRHDRHQRVPEHVRDSAPGAARRHAHAPPPRTPAPGCPGPTTRIYRAKIATVTSASVSTGRVRSRTSVITPTMPGACGPSSSEDVLVDSEEQDQQRAEHERRHAVEARRSRRAAGGRQPSAAADRLEQARPGSRPTSAISVEIPVSTRVRGRLAASSEATLSLSRRRVAEVAVQDPAEPAQGTGAGTADGPIRCRARRQPRRRAPAGSARTR